MSSDGLKRLNVWVQAQELALEIYIKVIPLLPPEEKWGLAMQLRRSTASVPANIAEGYGRYYFQSNIQFCYNARGSLDESISHILLARSLRYIPDDIANDIVKKPDALVLLLNGYIAYLKRSKQGENDLAFAHHVSEINDKYETAIIDESDESVFNNSQLSTLDSRSSKEVPCTTVD